MAGEWKEITFGNCAQRVSDVVQPQQVEERTPYIGLEHIIEGGLHLNGQAEASEATSAKTRFRRGDVLFGKLRPYFRKVVRPKFDGICSTDIWAIRAKNGVDQGFLFYRMASQEFVDKSMGASTGTRMPRADWGFLSQWEMPLPPLAEQKAIAAVLGALDDKIELNRRMNATLEAMARALFQSWFIDFDPVRQNMDRNQPSPQPSPSGRGRNAAEGGSASGMDFDPVRAKLDCRAPFPLPVGEGQGEGASGLPATLDPATAALFPASFQDSTAGHIPSGWRVMKVGEFIERLSVGQKYEQKTVSPVGKVPVLDQGKSGVIGFHNNEPGVTATLDKPVAVFANHTCYMRLITYSFSAIWDVLPFVGSGVDTFWACYATEGRLAFSEYKGHCGMQPIF